MAELAQAGVLTGVTLMPVLPFLEDSLENLGDILEMAAASGGQYIIPAPGLTLRDRQRDYFYQKLDQHFPGIRRRYEQAYGERMYCAPGRAGALDRFIRERCDRLGLATGFPAPERLEVQQPALF